jgi:hypothetical protein
MQLKSFVIAGLKLVRFIPFQEIIMVKLIDPKTRLHILLKWHEV